MSPPSGQKTCSKVSFHNVVTADFEHVFADWAYTLKLMGPYTLKLMIAFDWFFTVTRPQE